jgi:endonuclease/exonuclease/phosphatase (EEP) superfamily protein YafD
LQNSGDASLHWNTRPTWRSCKPAPACFYPRALALLLTLAFSLTLTPLHAAVNVEATACGEALAQPLAASGKGFKPRLQMLIWNIQKSGNKGWDTDLGRLGANSDLVLIQEASIQARVETALPQPLFRAFAAGYTTSKEATGVLTLSSVEPSLHCNLTAWEPWLGTPKATNITEYPIDGLAPRLLVINLHAVNFAVGLTDFNSQIMALEPLLSKHMGPLIIAGDFNTWSNNRSEFLHSFMLKHQLSPVTFEPDQRTRFWNLPLDHVYLRDLNLVKATSVIVESSDHNPLLITVELPQCIDCVTLSSEPPCTAC